MKIAIDISPLSSDHRVRGVGSYVSLIRDNIKQYDKKNTYVFFEKENIPTGVDLIHYPYFDPFFITLPASFKAKIVVTVHDLTPIVFKKHFPIGLRGKIKWQIQKSRLKKTDLIITDSNCSTKDVEDIVGVSGDKVKTVYLAVDPAFKKNRTEDRKLTGKNFDLPDKFLLYVGDATWNKNLPALIDAVKKTEYKLVIVGKVWSNSLGNINNNPWNDDLRYVLKKIEGDKQFINLGFISIEELVGVYNEATALIMPSIYEGFGLPVLEAMSCGCVVVASRGGSLPEVAGDAAFYIKGFESNDIEEAISVVMKNEDLRINLSEKGVLQAKNFSMDKMFKNLVSSYESLER